jgi:alanyl-tRNA synthetase
LGWELSTGGFGFDPELIWVSVFEGSDELGLGPDEESIDIWRKIGVPDERILKLPPADNFWQAGPTGPCGPCSEMYIDRGPEFGSDDVRPGDDTDRYLEYWNHVFMTYELHEDGTLTDLPQKNIDTGLGLERMAVIQQKVDSVFETDGFRPLITLAEELSGRSYDADEKTTRAMRIISDHIRGAVNLIADGVVPSNEERGYVLRRIMRRAIHQGRVLGLEAPYLGRFAEGAIESLGSAYPHLVAERAGVMRWVDDEERSFGRTLARGSELLAELVAEAQKAGSTQIDAGDAFKLHDTYGFPIDLTKELAAEEGLTVDDAEFGALMDKQRNRARVAVRATDGAGVSAEGVAKFVAETPPTSFVGYQTLASDTGVLATQPAGDDELLVKLEESPFYPEGGGQVSDSGVIGDESDHEVLDVYRVGDDQALRVRGPGPSESAVVRASVDRLSRNATMRNHTATHLLHAALRERLGTHVRQAGSAVRPDKLRFDFTHGAPLTADEVRGIEDRVNEWVKASQPVRAMEMERSEAEALGAMALFGEKYGDWVRVVEIEDVSRELCGGTHVASSAEVGIFTVVHEGSSAANVRRIEALTGPAAIDWFRARSQELDEAAGLLGGGDAVDAARRTAERLAALDKESEAARRREAAEQADVLARDAVDVGGTPVVVAESASADQGELMGLAAQIGSKLGDGAVVLGGSSEGKVALVARFGEGAVARGLSAADVLREAAAVVGGGGGGRENVAQAGGRDPAKLGEALQKARSAIEGALSA